MTQLRPLGLGEIIDRAASLWRANWKALFTLFLPFQLVGYIVFKSSLAAGRVAFPMMAGDALALEVLRTDPLAGLTQLLGFIAVVTGALLSSVLASQVASVGGTRLMFPRVTGQAAPDAQQSARFALARLGPTVGSFLLSVAWTALVGLLALAPGLIAGAAAVLVRDDHPVATLALTVVAAVLAGVASLLLLLWFIIRFVLLGQVIAVEQAGALTAFRRSAALASGSVGPGLLGWVKARLTVLLTIMGGVLLMVSLVSALPTLVLGLLYGANLTIGHTVDDVVPQLILVPVQLVQVVLGALVAPLFEALKVMFYVDMRVRREGLDLELKLA
jgi:hypothetical protein